MRKSEDNTELLLLLVAGWSSAWTHSQEVVVGNADICG